MVESNQLLYTPGEHPDHCVVIKYVPYVGDSKRAMDEYTSEILMGGHNTIVIHNTCEDSLLASSLILDLIILTELCQRIKFRVDGQEEFEGLVDIHYASRVPVQLLICSVLFSYSYKTVLVSYIVVWDQR